LFTLLGKNDDFLTYTFNAMMLLAVLVSCCLPALFWLDCPKYVQYLNRWAEFQVKYISISLMMTPIGIMVYTIAMLIKRKKNLVNYGLMQQKCEVGELAEEFLA